MTKKRRRYFLDRLPKNTSNHRDELIDPADVPDEIGKAIRFVEGRMLRCSEDILIYRARSHDPSQELSNAKALGSPPSYLARNNRMSGAGISMFYGAESEEAAIAEIKPGAEEAFTIGRWRPKRKLIYLDLPAAHPVPSIFDIEACFERPWLRFLVEFSEDLAKSHKDEEAEIEYVPTQIITEYVQYYLYTRENQRIDAIRYKSSICPQGVCWVIFAKPSDCGNSINHSDQLLMLDNNSVKRYEPGAWPDHRRRAKGHCRGSAPPPSKV